MLWYFRWNSWIIEETINVGISGKFEVSVKKLGWGMVWLGADNLVRWM